MKYDFSTVLQRKGHDALAVDVVGKPGSPIPVAPKAGFDAIPMWVADMNFPVVPTVQEEMAKRLQHPTFGYFEPREEYYDSIIRWQRSHNGVTELRKEHIGYQNGVLGGVASALEVFCSRGDKILVHSPTYIGFTNTLTNNGYQIVHSPLVPDEQGVWRMDFEDMERLLRQEHIHAAVFCSPHNPTGRVWERWEVEQVMELFRKYDVMVVSDEIWSDILLEGYTHVPTQSVSEDAKCRTIALYAPSKTFNLAGLVGSYHIIYDSLLRDRMEKQMSLSHYNTMNVMSMHALIGAYKPEGYQWVEELRQVITANVDFAVEYIRSHFEGVSVTRPQGTYMLFLDCTKWCAEHGKTLDDVLRAGWEVGVCWQDGRPFHGECHIRMNLALPMSRVQEAFQRLDDHVFCQG